MLICFLLLLALSGQSQRKVFTEEDDKASLNTQDAKDFLYPMIEKKERYNVAVLTPLYLDSVDLEKNLTTIPKFMMPGIDFYQGARIAADTLKRAGHSFNLFVYDSKSNYMDIKHIIESDKLDSMDVIIGNASVSDLKLLAEFARQKQINFISAVSPSDAGQEFNPYFTILQPRLASHIEKMHRHIILRSPEDNVVFINRNLPAEKNAREYFKNDVLNAMPGRYAEIEMKSEELNMQDIVKKIDTSYNTTIVLGILDPAVAYKNLKILSAQASRYNIKVYCMPTAEAIKSLSKPEEFPTMPIFYTTSYIIDKITPASQYIAKEYKKKMGGTPTDVVYKGFESLYFFANLMKRYGVPFNQYLGDNAYTFITPYKIVPVREKGVLKFYENKFLYLVRYDDGIMTYE